LLINSLVAPVTIDFARMVMLMEPARRKFGILQLKISCLVNVKLSMFSLEHLLVLLNKLDRDVDIVIEPKTKEKRLLQRML